MTKILEQMHSIHHVFIDLLKIPKEHFSPKIKFLNTIEPCIRFVFPDYLGVHFIKLVNKLQFIRHFQITMIGYEIFNGNQRRGKRWFIKKVAQVLAKIKYRAAVWKNNSQIIEL